MILCVVSRNTIASVQNNECHNNYYYNITSHVSLMSRSMMSHLPLPELSLSETGIIEEGVFCEADIVVLVDWLDCQ